MADATIYNPKVAWKTILNNVFQLTKETVENPATYRATIKAIDSNNIGAGQFETRFCCYDFMGNPYPIIATGTNTIDVIDIFRIKLCPTSGKIAVIIEPVIDGESLYLSQENFQGLHPLALANAHKYDIPILWKSRGISIGTDINVTKLEVENIEATVNPDPLLGWMGGIKLKLKNLFTTFLSLSDTPMAYTGQALKSLRVNAAEDGIEFTDESGNDTFTGLSDVINKDYIGKTLNVPIVNATETALELIETKEAEFIDLADVPSLYTGSEGYVVRVKSDGTGLEFVLLSGSDITTGLGFTPENIANKVVSITGASTDGQYPTAKLLFDKLVLKLDASLKGSINGLAELDASGFVKNTQLPSYVDDVLEYANFAALPVTGESGKIYVTINTNLTYRWSGSAYIEISASLALGETSATAYRGDRGKIAYDHSQTTHATVITGLTDNYLPKWNGSILVDSLFSDDGTSGIVHGALSASLFAATSFRVYGSTSGYSTIVSPAIAGTPTLTLPTISGILALVSDLGNYLPLTGGTLTGALTGTSATFSGSVTANNYVAQLPNSAINQIGLQLQTLSNDVGAGLTLSFGFNNAGGVSPNGASISSLISGMGKDLVFKTSTDNSGAIERLRIDGVGAATFSGSVTAPNLPLAGSFSQTVTAVTTFVVTIGQIMANTTYKVCVTPTSMLSAAVFYVTSKSTTQFTVTYLTGLTGVVSFDWIIVP